jgi:hypothetical protein
MIIKNIQFCYSYIYRWMTTTNQYINMTSHARKSKEDCLCNRKYTIDRLLNMLKALRYSISLSFSIQKSIIVHLFVSHFSLYKRTAVPMWLALYYSRIRKKRWNSATIGIFWITLFWINANLNKIFAGHKSKWSLSMIKFQKTCFCDWESIYFTQWLVSSLC